MKISILDDYHDTVRTLGCFAKLPFSADLPNCVIAHTTKGKGVSFMENSVLWHYRSPQGDELKAALRELGAPEHA